LVAPKVRKDLDIPESVQENAKRTLISALNTLDNCYLSDRQYLIGDAMTLADIAAYVEIGQLQPQFTDVLDLSAWPNVQRWLS
ncbi:hypothetical protein HA388_31175, partial [Escherichia coli]|nr:hypothetical protein [Escherichia coli]